MLEYPDPQFLGGPAAEAALPESFNNQQVIPPALADTIIGKIYVQSNQIGLASYHFNAEEGGSYISYVNAPAGCTLDNGQQPANYMSFEATEYNQAERTFKGTVFAEGSPANSAGLASSAVTRWEYRMQFSPDLQTIESGHVNTYNENNSLCKTMLFGR